MKVKAWHEDLGVINNSQNDWKEFKEKEFSLFQNQEYKA